MVAVLLYSTTPVVPAFSSIAYTDIVVASTQLAAIFAFVPWLEVTLLPDFRRNLHPRVRWKKAPGLPEVIAIWVAAAKSS